jgi:hypothetical protein
MLSRASNRRSKVISTGDPVLPGARGRVWCFVTWQIDPILATIVVVPRWSSRMVQASELRRFLRGTGLFPSPVRDRDHLAESRRPPRRLGEAYRGVNALFREDGLHPCSTWLRDRSAASAAKVRPVSGTGSRSHAALGLLMCGHVSVIRTQG